MIYANLVKKLINYMFGTEHPIVVNEIIEKTNGQTKVVVHIFTNEEYFAKIIGRKGTVINCLTSLLKIKSYLNNCHAVIKIEK